MNLHSLKPAQGSVRKNKRLGRGDSSGKGGTSTRGHKGDGSRSGSRTKLGFEGGQMPLYRRVPKYGFKSPFRVEYTPINLDVLNDLVQKTGKSTFDLSTLKEAGLISKSDKVKVLGRGEITTALTLTVHAISESARTAVENAGGKITLIEKQNSQS
jgi:large subunit ribosomal protein L15